MNPASLFPTLLEPTAVPAAIHAAKDLPQMTLDGTAVNELELWMIGALPPESVQLRPAEGLPADAAAVVLRDHEGVPLALLSQPHLDAEGCLRGTLQGWQRPPNRDFIDLRKTPQETRQRLQPEGERKVVVWALGAPPAAAEVSRAQATLPDEAELLVLILSAPMGRDDPQHFRRVRAIREAFAATSTACVLVPSPHHSTAARRAQLCLAYGAEKQLAFTGAETDPALPTLFLAPEPGYDAEAALTRPQAEQGYCVFFTGLSGSGKSTMANELLVRLLEQGERAVTLLDGDLVRQNLSSELGFSKADRDLNIRRIGFVASLIVKSGGVAICAPIAPYEATRQAVREMIRPHGGYMLIHVATPLEECERRDRKGLYAKARQGIIKEFTGISDPYEAPEEVDLRLDTTGISLEEATQRVLDLLQERGWI